MIEVQKFLQENSIEDLEEKFNITVNTSYDDRIVLNYGIVHMPGLKYHDIVKECRGLILEKDTYKVLCRSFDRFYNYGEDPESKNFPITDSICTEKLDGTLFNVYFDNKQWNVATRKMAFAEGSTDKGNPFRSIFERGLKRDFQATFKKFDPDHTYIFEGVSPENRVVTPYSDYEVYLLAIRNKHTGEYIDNVNGFSKPKVFYFDDIDEILKSCKELPTLEEGYVCYHPNTSWRIKIKNPHYLAIYHIRGEGLTTKRIVTLVFNQDYDEYLSYFPEDRQFFIPYIEAFSKMKEVIETTYNKYKDIENQKEFALSIKDLPIKHILFSLRKGLNIEEIFDKITIESKVELLEKYKDG